MRWVTSDRVGRGTRGAGLVALAALAWGVLDPNDLFWTVTVGAGLIGLAVATVLPVRSRSTPTVAKVIAAAEALRPRGARTWRART